MKKFVIFFSVCALIATTTYLFVINLAEINSYSIQRLDLNVQYMFDDGLIEDYDGNQMKCIRYFYQSGSTIQDPTKMEGYTVIHESKKFVGWYLEGASQPWNFDEGIIHESIILFAHWE